MLLGEIFQSIDSWQKLSGISMKPKLAYKILKYTKLVSDEHRIVEKQRVALIYEISGTEEGQDAKIEPNTPELQEYVKRFNAVMVTESDLPQLQMDFEEVVNAVDEKDETLTINDLAMLEPFFLVSGSLRKQESPNCDVCNPGPGCKKYDEPVECDISKAKSPPDE